MCLFDPSDLRSRINEKRSDPHPRVDERERERRYESDRERGERHGRPHHSSPPRERRRPGKELNQYCHPTDILSNFNLKTKTNPIKQYILNYCTGL